MNLTSNKTYLGYVKSTRKGGTFAIISVFAEKNDGLFQITDAEEEVFVTKSGSYYQNDLYELKEIGENTQVGDGYKAPWVTRTIYHASRTPVFKYRRQKQYMDLESIGLVPEIARERDISKFILQDIDNPNLFYGYFKKTNGKVEAKEFKHIHTYALADSRKYVFEMVNGKSFFLNDELGNPQSKIDCSSIDQLINWLKDKVRDSINLKKGDIDLLKKLMSASDVLDNELDNVRFDRVKTMAASAYNGFVEIKSLFENKESPLFENLQEEIEEYKKQSRVDIETAFNKEMAEKRHEILSGCEEELHNKENDIKRLDKEIKEKTDSLEKLNQNYDSVLATLKLALPILKDSRVESNSVVKSQSLSKMPLPIVFSSDKKAVINSEKSILMFYTENLKGAVDDASLGKILKDVKLLLASGNACFIPCVTWAYIYAIAVQRSRVWVLHVEHDWVHYSNLCENGLVEIWTYATDHPDENCVLVLDSINLTQPECGMKPLLDVINGVSPILMGTNLMYPDNLKVFATVVPSGDECLPGLKLQESSFAKWDCIGKPDDESLCPQLNNQFLKNEGDKKYISIQDIRSYLKVNEIEDNQKKRYLGE